MSDSTVSMKMTPTIPDASSAMDRMIVPSPAAITTTGWPVASRSPRSRGPSTNHRSPLSTPPCTAAKKRSTTLEGCRSGPGRCARWLGRISSDSTRETSSTEIRMIESGRIMAPMGPGSSRSGAKAPTVVRTAKIRGRLTRCTPRIAAATPGVPFCRSACTFSATTMASSTTMPTARMNANSEIVLMDTSKARAPARAPRKEMPIPAATHTASRISRNSASAVRTSSSPRAPFSSSRSSRLS